jgi:hypothetical protein
MNIYTDAMQENTNRAMANNLSTQQGNNQTASRQVVNNSPQVKQLSAYQQMANSSPQVKQLKAYQQMANTANQPIAQKEAPGNTVLAITKATTQNKPVVQRAVITVNGDHLIGENAQTVANVTNAAAGAFSEVRDDETIYIFAHGYHSLTEPLNDKGETNLEPVLMGGITAADLCRMMMAEGWRKEHTGDIDIRACMSGAESMLPSFAQLFATELKKAGRPNMVTGYKHLSKTEDDGSETAMKPTISKMIDIAQKFDPKNFRQKMFASTVTGMYESRIPGLLELRTRFDEAIKFGKAYMIGAPTPKWGMTQQEWNVYGFYHAVETGNANLMDVLKHDFGQTAHIIDRPVGGKHDRRFNPHDMQVPVEEEQDDNSEELAKLLEGL